jgi:hypothetical protein
MSDVDIRQIADEIVFVFGLRLPPDDPRYDILSPRYELPPDDEERVIRAILSARHRPSGRRMMRRLVEDERRVRAREHALALIDRVARLDRRAACAVVVAWRDVMRTESGAWLGAEMEIERAMKGVIRPGERQSLLRSLADALASAPWYPALALRTEEALAPESSIEYLATLAVLALLVRDDLEPAAFEVLSRPFASHLPPESPTRA